jgi:thiosulfate/3-mercaptopyruvate sulfurtransferase
VYDNHLGNRAARIWWILKYWGVKEARLLNGEWQGWQAIGGTVTGAAPSVKARPFSATAAEKWRLATRGQLLAALPKSALQIIDARSEGEFCGTANTAKHNGAIPGSRHLEWSDTLDKRTQRFKSPAQLRELFRQAGINPDRPSVTYCQSGGRAAVMAFVLELMGGRDVRNYYRSWAEWGNAEDTPIARPSDKTGK